MQSPYGVSEAFPELSRRGFLIGGGTLAVGALAAACSGSGGSSIDTFSAAFQGSGVDESIDPGIVHQFIDEARLKTMYDGLFEVDDQMSPVPRLAASGEPNADGTRWRIKLRDARWHDGKKFTSADVLYTFSRILGPAGKKPFYAAKVLKQVDLSQSKALDEKTVEIALMAPSFEFLTALTAIGTKIVQDGAKDFSKAVGTGPFKFESFDPGQELVVTANPDYWDGAPNIQRLKILSVDADARTTALQSGQIDFADDLTASAVKTLRETGDIAVNMRPNSGIYYFAMKTDRPPFDNPDVRRALMRMADRDELVKVAMEGQADVANDAFGKGFQYYAGDLPQHRFDPDEAKFLLRKAGASGLSFDLPTAQVASGFVEAANLIAEQAKKSGVNINVVTGSKDTYYSDTLNNGALTMGQSGPAPIPNHFASRLLTGSPQNRSKWSDPEFDALYAKAQATSAPEARAAIYHRMQEILHDRGGLLFWANSYWHNAAGSKFKNVPNGVPNSLHWSRFDKVSL
jgi:peptide/nickel transport system substrate-binding protein